jgi:predicted SprT family Zn-dependent metalloprotease
MNKNLEFEKFILQGLKQEWIMTAGLYCADQNKNFKCPVFSLNDSKSFFGLWNLARYEISIQRNFALKESWEKIRHVLRHEMAHQYADVVLKQKNEPSHGKSFQKACKILRVSSKASFDLINDKTCFLNSNSCVSKIKKLFSLSTSSNANEAELAMKKAHELMEKYNFDKIDISKEDYFSVFLGKPGLRHFKEAYYLAGLLSRFYFVYPVWVPCFVKEKGKTGKILEISGRFSNVQIASYVYDYVNSYIDKVWVEFNSNNLHGRYNKSDFAAGIIHGFSSKLEEKNNYSNYHSQSNLPAAIDSDPDLKPYLDWYYPKLSSKTKKSTVSKDIYEKGIKKGKELTISKGISENKFKDKKILIK